MRNNIYKEVNFKRYNINSFTKVERKEKYHIDIEVECKCKSSNTQKNRNISRLVSNLLEIQNIFKIYLYRIKIKIDKYIIVKSYKKGKIYSK